MNKYVYIEIIAEKNINKNPQCEVTIKLYTIKPEDLLYKKPLLEK